MITAVVKGFVPVLTLKPLTHCALPLAQNARWNYSRLPGEHRGITVFVLDSVPDFMRSLCNGQPAAACDFQAF
jgi:hypothetical protein